METTFEICIFISGKEKKQLQKCNTTILLSMHDKPGTSNVCDYRVLYSFTMIDSFRDGESHNYTKAPGCFICSTDVVVYIR
jgi:hypothetical protein